MLLNDASPHWKARLPPTLSTILDSQNPPPDLDGTTFRVAWDQEAIRRLKGFLDGVEKYRTYPYRRRLPAVPVVWQQGTTSLLDYGVKEHPEALPVLVVPSLINRCSILDLTARRSFMRTLARNGLRPFLIDWDAPGQTERRFGIADYIVERLVPAAEEVRRLTGKPAAVVGYCMGGQLALALALLRPDLVSAYVALATPWNFHADDSRSYSALMAAKEGLITLAEAVGELPLDALQTLFACIDPPSIGAKFRRFATLDPKSQQAQDFVALEDWLNDGVALAAPVTRECLDDWMGRNDPARLAWMIGKTVIDPAALTVPALCLIPSADRIVPPRSALALADALPNGTTTVRMVPLGHIGMMVARGAMREVYTPTHRWLRAHALAFRG